MVDFKDFSGDDFFVGCNYWSSHAGTYMWRNYREDIVEKDFAALNRNHVQVIRMFPLWPDFQPIHMHAKWANLPCDMRFEDQALPDTEAGRAGVDETMVEHFRNFCDLATKYNLKLVVGLVTGWMSGRMYVPPAFYNVNVLTDPTAIKWQVRMVRYLVKSMKHHPAIMAWDLGNECNCMGSVTTAEEAWVWSNAVTAAIKIEDPVRPVVSGMHSLVCFDNQSKWLIEDQGEITDVLTTHPYPLFTPYCNMDQVNTFRNAFHAVSETKMYGDIGHAVSFIEEAGSLGPTFSSDETAAKYLRNMLWNAYSHNCRGLLWWCANDQTKLEQTPYVWNAMERELGLLDVKHQPKPTLKVMSEFAEIVKKLNLKLPEFRKDAVAVMSQDQDNWGVGYATFLLAKKAGFDIEYQTCTQPIRDAKLYLLPSVRETRVIPRERYYELLSKVEAGATLLVTSDGGSLQPLGEVFGMDIVYREKAVDPLTVTGNGYEFTCKSEFRVHLKANRARVLAVDQNQQPVLTIADYGKGRVLFCSVPLEHIAVNTLRAFLPGAPAFYKIYAEAAAQAGIHRNVTRANDQITLTEHVFGNDKLIVIAVNNTPETVVEKFTSQWRLNGVLYGKMLPDESVEIAGNSAAVLQYVRG